MLRRLLPQPLRWVLAALLAVLVTAGAVTSAQAADAAGTRVGASAPISLPRTWSPAADSSTPQRGFDPTYDELATACCVTAKGTAAEPNIADGLLAGLRDKAGFAAKGEPLIVDNSLPVSPQRVAEALREAGFNARSVREIFGRDPGDTTIREVAEMLNGRVVATDVGHDIAGGFGRRVITVPGRIRTVESILRLVKGS